MSKYVIDGAIYENVDKKAHPGAVKVSDTEAAQIEAGTHYLNADGVVVPIEQYVPTLEELKAQAIATLQANGDAAIADGVTVTLDGTQYTLAATERDQELFTRDGTRIASEKIGDPDGFDPDEPVFFRGYSGSSHVLPVSQYAKLLGLYARTIRGVWQQVAQKYVQVGECTTAEEIAALELSISEGAP